MSLAKDLPVRRLTSVWTLSYIGLLARRSRVLIQYRLLGDRLAVRRDFKAVMSTGSPARRLTSLWTIQYIG